MSSDFNSTSTPETQPETATVFTQFIKGYASVNHYPGRIMAIVRRGPWGNEGQALEDKLRFKSDAAPARLSIEEHNDSAVISLFENNSIRITGLKTGLELHHGRLANPTTEVCLEVHEKFGRLWEKLVCHWMQYYTDIEHARALDARALDSVEQGCLDVVFFEPLGTDPEIAVAVWSALLHPVRSGNRHVYRDIADTSSGEPDVLNLEFRPEPETPFKFNDPIDVEFVKEKLNQWQGEINEVIIVDDNKTDIDSDPVDAALTFSEPPATATKISHRMVVRTWPGDPDNFLGADLNRRLVNTFNECVDITGLITGVYWPSESEPHNTSEKAVHVFNEGRHRENECALTAWVFYANQLLKDPQRPAGSRLGLIDIVYAEVELDQEDRLVKIISTWSSWLLPRSVGSVKWAKDGGSKLTFDTTKVGAELVPVDINEKGPFQFIHQHFQYNQFDDFAFIRDRFTNAPDQ